MNITLLDIKAIQNSVLREFKTRDKMSIALIAGLTKKIIKMSNDNKKVFRVSYQTLTEPKQINIRALTFAGAENYFYSMYPAKDNTITNIEKL